MDTLIPSCLDRSWPNFRNMTSDLSRISDSESNQPLKWLEWAPETPIRGPEGPKVVSKALNMRGSASNPFLVHQQIEKPKMLRMKFWTSDFDVKKWSRRPRDPHNRICLEKLCPTKWSQIEKTLDGCPQNDEFGIFVRSLRTLLWMLFFLIPDPPSGSRERPLASFSL